jgi:hypothetical protein
MSKKKSASTPISAPRTVAAALEDVAKWRNEASTKSKSEIVDVDLEIEKFQAAIASLQQQIEALRKSRDEIAKKDGSLVEEEIGRSYNAVFAALTEQMEAVRGRATSLAESDTSRSTALTEALKDPTTAALMTEYTQFKTTVEPTLKALPDSYKAVIMQHHDGVAKKLRDTLEKVGGTAAPVDGPELSVDAVFAVDAPDGAPEVLMMVLPVQEQVGTDWQARTDDAQTWVAARVIQGAYAALQGAGLATARVAFGGHQGLLAVEVEIAGAKKDFGSNLQFELRKALAGAKELTAAKITVNTRELVVDHLLPPEEDA